LLGEGGMGERPAWVFSMWVDPAVRRQGTAQALLRALTGWARGRGADVLNLHVTETNAPAIALYERLGFRATGETEPLPHTPSLRENHMACRLDDFIWQ
jgi:ribosomal protein S18 acetylase RimI-like enzyme